MKIPPQLHKFRSLKGESRDFTMRSIVDDEVYFARRTEFNDPFDCRLNIRGEISPRLRAEMDATTDGVGIFCLSARQDSLLMWSHYADGHRGICLEFRPTEERLFGCRLDPVIYNHTYPELSTKDELDLEWSRRYLTTKANEWSYEDEWRIIYHTPGVQVAPPDELSAVILGCDISDADRDSVVEWIRTRKHTVDLYQAERAEGAFVLTFTLIHHQDGAG